MAFAPMQEKQGEELASLAAAWKPGFPRSVDLARTIPAIESAASKSAKPVIVKTGDAKEATKVAVELTTKHPEQYITSFTKAGDLQVLNTTAVIEDIKTRLHDRGAATTVAIGSLQGALGITRRLKEAGITASVDKAGYVHALDPDAFADRVRERLGKYTTRTTNSDLGSKQEAEAVAKAINERSNGDLFASANGSKIDVINVAQIATQMYRSRTSGTGTIDAVYTRQEAAAVTKYFNDEYAGQYTAVVKDNGAFEVNRVGLSKS